MTWRLLIHRSQRTISADRHARGNTDDRFAIQAYLPIIPQSQDIIHIVLCKPKTPSVTAPRSESVQLAQQKSSKDANFKSLNCGSRTAPPSLFSSRRKRSKFSNSMVRPVEKLTWPTVRITSTPPLMFAHFSRNTYKPRTLSTPTILSLSMSAKTTLWREQSPRKVINNLNS